VLFVHWIVAGLDRGRFHWRDSVPPWLQALALIAVAGGYALCFWGEPVLFLGRAHPGRARPVRGHAGPYAYVRHPGYLAGILIMVASGPALGSWLAAALLVISSLPFLIHRAITEDRVLRGELPGYSDYASRVRWRLLPGIW
jgi:protein-S-isoprenylcysteine O-methyltransferase Ste14